MVACCCTRRSGPFHSIRVCQCGLEGHLHSVRGIRRLYLAERHARVQFQQGQVVQTGNHRHLALQQVVSLVGELQALHVRVRGVRRGAPHERLLRVRPETEGVEGCGLHGTCTLAQVLPLVRGVRRTHVYLWRLQRKRKTAGPVPVQLREKLLELSGRGETTIWKV